MKFNKKRLRIDNKKIIMRKVKKRWVLTSILTLSVLGLSSFVQNETIQVSADVSEQSNNKNGTDDSSIEHIKWGTANATFDNATKVLTVGYDDDGNEGVLAENNALNDIPFRSEVKKIVFKSPVKLPSNSSWVFGNLTSLTDFEGLNKVDSSNVNNMDNLFSQDKNLQNIDISGWNTSNVTSMNSLFNGPNDLKEINITGINTSKVTDMYGMFANSYKLKKVIGVNDLDFSNVTNMAYWFGYDPGIETLDLSKVNAPKLQNANYMFIDDSSLKYVNLANFNSQNLIPEPDNGLTQMFFFINEERNGTDDREFSSSTVPNINSSLTTFITGENFNTSAIRFESFGGNRGVFGTRNGEIYYSNSRHFSVVNNHLVYDTEDPKKDNSSNNSEQYIYTSTVLWSAVQFRYIDGYTNKQLGNNYLYQGYANSTGLIPIPDGYGVPAGNDVKFKMPVQSQMKLNDFMDVVIYKKLNPVINFVDNGLIVSTRTINNVLQGQQVNVSDLVPNNYKIESDDTVTVTKDSNPFNILVTKIDGNSNSTGSSSASSSAESSAQSSSAENSPQSSSAESSAQSSSAESSAQSSSAESSAQSSSAESSAQSSSAESSAQSSSAESSAQSSSSGNSRDTSKAANNKHQNNGSGPINPVSTNKNNVTTPNRIDNNKKTNVGEEDKNKDKLPQTGDFGTETYQKIGLLMLVLSIVLSLFRLRRNDR